MSYDSVEKSVSDGRPVELYKFGYTLNEWRFTSADRDLTYLSQTYKSALVSRSNLAPSTDASKASLTISLRGTSPLSSIFISQPPSEPVLVTIFAEHWDPSTDTPDMAVLWKGRIKGAEWKDSATLVLTSESVFSSLQRSGLRRRFQFGCPFALYGSECGVARATYAQTGTVMGMTGTSIVVNSAISKPDAWYAGGYVTWTNYANQNVEKRMIRSSVGATGSLELSTIAVGLKPGQEVTIYPGCDHTLDGVNGCAAKFNNFKRFGGTPFMPTQSPFGGSTIY